MNIGDAMHTASEHFSSQRYAQAQQLYLEILKHDAKNPQAIYMAALTVAALGRPADAEKLLQYATSLEPNSPDIWSALAEMHRRLGKFDESESAHRHAISLPSANANAFSNFGVLLRQQRRFAEAAESAQKAIAFDSMHFAAMEIAALSLVEIGRVDQALALAHRMSELQPRNPTAFSTLSEVHLWRREIDEAVSAAERAVELAPDSADMHHALAVALLQRGDFRRGWEEYEWRFGCEGFEAPRAHLPGRLWRDEDLRNKKLLVYSEQGMGDAIQMARFIPQLKAVGCEIVVESPPSLARIFQTLEGVTQIIPVGQSLPAVDFNISIMSLAHRLRASEEQIKITSPYLCAEESLANQWRHRLAHLRRPHIGLAWAGNPNQVRDRQRSVALKMFEPFASVGTLISLQKGPATQQLSQIGFPITDFTSELNDFTETAALISGLDFVITVDTVIVHLAGSLMKPCHLLLSAWPDWRWPFNREVSPWYPTVKMHRQRTAGDWQEPIEQLLNSLK